MKFIFLLAAAAVLAVPAASQAATFKINPISDGSLYVCDGCNTVVDGNYVITSGYVQGAVKFSSSIIAGPVSRAVLTLNPYGLPLHGPTVDVYGYGTTIGRLNELDASAGTFLGTLTLPPNLGYGEDAAFNVTAFVAGVKAPYIAFNLRSTGLNVFSSLEYNYGHPAQLWVTTAPVPEPATPALFLAGILMLARLRSHRRASHAAGIIAPVTSS